MATTNTYNMGTAATGSATFTERDVAKGFIQQINMDCPLTTMIPKKPAPLTSIHEWQLKTYTASRATGTIEGVKPVEGDFENNQLNKTMLASRFIKQSRAVSVTKEAKLMANQYSVANPLADNLADMTAVLYMDVEMFLASDTEAVPPTQGTVASSTRSIGRWLSQANGRFTDTATTPVITARTPAASILVSRTTTSGTSTDITEADLSALITSVAKTRKQTSKRFLGLVTPDARNLFDGYSKIDKTGSSSTSYPISRFAQQQGTIDREITLYKSSLGSIELMTHFRLDSTIHMLLLTPDMLAMKYAQSLMVTPLPENGVQEERFLDVIYVVEALNPQAHGKIISGATA